MADAVSIWINVGIFLATAAAAFFAWRQLVAARRASADAKKHEEAALIASQSAAESAGRSADEHKRIADIAARQLEITEAAANPPTPWAFAHVDGQWYAVNQTGLTVVWAQGYSEIDNVITTFEFSASQGLGPGDRIGFSVLDPSRASVPITMEWLLPGASTIINAIFEVRLR